MSTPSERIADTLRFGIVIPPDAPFAELRQRWRDAEIFGFDVVYVPDVIRDWRDEQGPWFDCWTAVAALAEATTTARIGTLVTNTILRAPAVLAKAAATIDHLSGGRLELGIGTGIAPFDHIATGTPYWSTGERVARFREHVAVVDGLLRSADAPFAYEGEYYSTEGLAMRPAPVQRPRPPITVGGKAPTLLRTAAAHAEVWSTDGPYGASLDERVAATIEHNRQLDDLCEEVGRDPASLRRSMLLYQEPGPGTFHNPWDTPGRFAEAVEKFSAIGMRDIVVCWPEHDAEREVFEHVATSVLPTLRG